MGIWRNQPTVEAVRRIDASTMASHVGIQVTEIGADFLRGTMPVDSRTQQPFGLLHGGASAVLAETLGSIAGNLAVDAATHYCVGLEINVNHLRGVRAGTVTGTTRPLHLGRRTQVWDIRIEDEAGKLTAVSRLTLAVLEQ